MARDRKGAQLALELEPQLMQRLRARAAADGRPVAVLVRRWIEAGLCGALEQQATAAAPAAGPELLARVAALEAAVSDLQRPASPNRVSAAPRSGEPVTPKRVPMGAGTLEIIGAAHLQAAAASPERVILQAQPGEPLPLPERRLTPAEAAGLLTTPRGGKGPGAVLLFGPNQLDRPGGQQTRRERRGRDLPGPPAEGKGPAARGQKPGWLWEPVW